MNTLLIIGHVWPEPSSSAAGHRMMELIALFRAANYRVTFASAAMKSDMAENLKTQGVDDVLIELNNSSFDIFLKDLQPNLVLFDRFMTEEQYGWRVEKQCPNALRILNTEDIHSLRKARESIAHGLDSDDWLTYWKGLDITKREIASIYRCDVSFIISSYEMELLRKEFNFNDDQLLYIPFLRAPLGAKIKKNWNSFTERQHFVTIGNFKHPPNWNSVLYLKKTIWPLLKAKLPEAELHIYGAYPTQKVLELHNKNEGFFIKGWAPDSLSVLQAARVCLAPLQFGAGLKGKLVEAMQAGTPNVTTSIGAEGMLTKEADWNGFVIDDPFKFAQAACTLYQNQKLWKQSQQNGIEIYNTFFNKNTRSASIIKTIQNLRNNLEEIRNNNFMGAMLNFHTMRSTEFMSRWIEEKNKK